MRSRLAVTAAALLSVVLLAVTAVHKAQDAAYWQYLEDALLVEQAAREEWQRYVEALEEQATHATLAAVRDGNIAAELPAECDTPPTCAPADCPPADTKGPARQSAVQLAKRTAAEQPSASDGRYFDRTANDGVDFKIYVYDLPEEFNSGLKAEQERCVIDQYGTEIRFHEQILESAVHTVEPEEAEFFFVPIYGECHLYQQTALHGKGGLAITNDWYLRGLHTVTHSHPWWNRTQGRDHLFVFAGARGAHIFKDWKKHIRKSIFLTPEGDRSLGEQFNTWKDIVIPGLEFNQDFWSGKLRRLEMERDTFLYFRGTIHHKSGSSYSKGIRIELEKVLAGQEGIVYSEHSGECGRDCYRLGMRKSVFCLCTRGWSPWTLRAYQSLMVGCIPVIIADEIEFPYENELDWSALTVKIPEANATQILDILHAIPEAQIEAKRKAIQRMWHTVTWPEHSKPGDAFHSVLVELQRKRRYFKASPSTWWL